MMEDPRVMSKARRKGLERGKEKRLRGASTLMLVVKEKRKLSFSHPHHRRGELEAYAASAIQQPVVKHEQERKPEVMGAFGVLPPSFQSHRSSSKTKQFSFQRLVPP